MRFIFLLLTLILGVSCASGTIIADSELLQMKTEKWSTDQIEKKFGSPATRQSGMTVCNNKRGSQWVYSSGNMLSGKTRVTALQFDDGGKLCDFQTTQNH